MIELTSSHLKLLDADATQIDWKTTARNVLLLDPEADIEAARRMYTSHLARAQWMSRVGYRHLLSSLLQSLRTRCP